MAQLVTSDRWQSEINGLDPRLTKDVIEFYFKNRVINDCSPKNGKKKESIKNKSFLRNES